MSSTFLSDTDRKHAETDEIPVSDGPGLSRELFPLREFESQRMNGRKMWGYLLACRSGGTIPSPASTRGFIDKFPMGAIVNRALTIRSGQTHVHHYMRPLLECVAKRQVDPSFVITHRMRLDDAPEAYDIFNDKEDECL